LGIPFGAKPYPRNTTASLNHLNMAAIYGIE
jgi:hypothetical protein